MPVTARLATIRLLVALEPVLAPPTNWDASILQSLRVTRTTFTLRHNPSFGITTVVVAIPMDVSSGPGLPPTVAQVGLTWRVLREVHSEIAKTVSATIRRTGMIRASLWIRTIRTAFSSTPSTFGLQHGLEQFGTILPVVTRTPAAQVPCTWTNTRWRSCRARPASWQSGTMVVCTERRTPTLQRKQLIRPGLT